MYDTHMLDRRKHLIVIHFQPLIGAKRISSVGMFSQRTLYEYVGGLPGQLRRPFRQDQLNGLFVRVRRRRSVRGFTFDRQQTVAEIPQRVDGVLRFYRHGTGAIDHHQSFDVLRVHGREHTGHHTAHAVSDTVERCPRQVSDNAFDRDRVTFQRYPETGREVRRTPVPGKVDAHEIVTIPEQWNESVERTAVILFPVETENPGGQRVAPSFG